MIDTSWVDRSEYPFAPHWMNLDAGRMHYIDQGQGSPIVFVHGTPSWSFLYRHQIAALSQSHRCVAPDHLGFGLSEKPRGWSYGPSDHAANLRIFIERLGLHDITLVVHDFGGPIGLSYALERPENVRQIVLMNTFLWPFAPRSPITRAMMKTMGGPLGRILYEQGAFSLNVMLPQSFGDKRKLTPQIRQQYAEPFPTAKSRYPTWVLARAVLGEADWFQSLWDKREAIADIPALILWGMKDFAFTPDDLRRWQGVFHEAETVTFADTGHFVAEEQGAALVTLIQDWFARHEQIVA